MGFPNGAGKWLQGGSRRTELVERLHGLLRGSGAPISGAREPFDMIYDIFASIILGYISYEDALGVAPEGDGRGLVRKMFASATAWVDSIPSDGGQATIIVPW
jgi:hypothetical protein